jgi:acetyltransferase-like isoleucine patch superfamily enzyme
MILYGFLPNFLKILIYRLRGYKIGRHVSIGVGSVIIGETVTIGEYTTIGFLTILRGKNITIGTHVTIGSTTFLDTPNVDIGDGTKINEQVYVGGLQFPDSRLVLGRNCQVMQMSFINPARSIIVGDDTGIGGHCLLFGHTSWLSQLEGYPVEFEPIEIGSSVSLAWRVFVLPGTKIGDGAVIAANSLVNRSIPPRCLAAGFPARVVSKFPDFPKQLTDEERRTIFRSMVDGMLQFFLASGLNVRSCDQRYEVTHLTKKFFRTRTRRWQFRILEHSMNEEQVPADTDELDVLLSLKSIPPRIRKNLNSRKIMWIDIERKEQPLFRNDLGDEITLFLKRYGVRLFRVPG